MRILQIYDLVPENGGPTDGVGLAILQLSQALTRMGHKVLILGGMGRNPEKTGRFGEVMVRRAERFGLMRRTWSPTNLTFGRQFLFPPVVLSQRELLKEVSSFDVAHGHVYSAGFVALQIGKKLDIPICNTIHGSYHEVWNQIMNPNLAPFIRIAERQVVSYLARNVDCQIHTDRFFAEMVERWGIDRSKLRVIHNGVARELLDRWTEPCQRETPVFFTARRLVRKNGVDLLLKALSLLLKKRSARLRVAGDGPEYGRLVALAESLRIRDSVEFLGVLPHTRIPEFIEAGTVGVLPSLAEASSLFLLECMALGRPVVCTSVGGITEIVDADTAWLVQPGDENSLAEGMLLSTERWDESLSKARIAHRRAVERHAWSNVAAQTVECYNQS